MQLGKRSHGHSSERVLVGVRRVCIPPPTPPPPPPPPLPPPAARECRFSLRWHQPPGPASWGAPPATPVALPHAIRLRARAAALGLGPKPCPNLRIRRCVSGVLKWGSPLGHTWYCMGAVLLFCSTQCWLQSMCFGCLALPSMLGG